MSIAMAFAVISVLATFSFGAAPHGRAAFSYLAQNTSEQGAPTAGERSSAQPETAQNQTNAGKNQAKREKTTQTLTGTVEWEYKPLAWDCDVPNCDHFALYADATHINYELDDARKALPFEGKRAKVMGVVDEKNHVIHLLSIGAEK